MNPLDHFGIRSQFIRGDTRSYNDEDLLPPARPIIPNRFPPNSRMVRNDEKIFYGKGQLSSHIVDESKPTHTLCGRPHRPLGYPEPIQSRAIQCKSCLKRSGLAGSHYEYKLPVVAKGR